MAQQLISFENYRNLRKSEVLRASIVKLDSFLSAQWICCGQDKKEDEGTFIFPSSTKGNQFNALFIITRILNPFIFLHTGLLNF